MRILNEQDKEIQESEINREKGYLRPDKVLKKHHDAVEAKPEVHHYEAQRFIFTDGSELDVSTLGNEDPHVRIVDLENGVFQYVDQGEGKEYFGLDIKDVIDSEAVEAKEAYDEYEDIQRYVLYTAEELKANAEAKKKQEEQTKFLTAGPQTLESHETRISGSEQNIDDINLILAESMGTMTLPAGEGFLALPESEGLTGAAYRIVKRAIAIRIESGEDITKVVNHYTKLSAKQMDELIKEFSSKVVKE